MEIISTNNKAILLKAMTKLVQGQKVTTKLQELINSQTGSGLEEDLVAQILESFNDVILVLDSFETIASSSSSTSTLIAAAAVVEGSQNASCDSDGKVEDSGDSKKRLRPVKGKRGCYKRKKKSETWTIESSVLDDEFSWRKYGQKDILNTKFPRSYFRCTHKYSLECKATKQVQKVENEPKMFSITYTGNHTCNNNEPTLENKPCVNHHDDDDMTIDSQEFKNPSLTTSTKGHDEEINHHNGSSTQNDLQLVWPEMLVFEDNESLYGCVETSESINGLESTDLWSW
ncbi:unnamed protein product [Cochlearia groenlandica]